MQGSAKHSTGSLPSSQDPRPWPFEPLLEPPFDAPLGRQSFAGERFDATRVWSQLASQGLQYWRPFTPQTGCMQNRGHMQRPLRSSRSERAPWALVVAGRADAEAIRQANTSATKALMLKELAAKTQRQG